MMQFIADINSSEIAVYLWETVGMELCLFALTCLGFVVFKSEAVQNLIPRVWNFFATGKLVSTVKQAPDVCNPDYLPVKELEANFNSGQFDIVLDSWASLKYLPVTALGAVVQSLLATHKQLEIPDTLKRALSSHSTLRTPEAMHAILEVMIQAKSSLDSLAQVCAAFSGAGVHATDATFECLVAALRRADPQQAFQFFHQVSGKQSIPVRAYALLIKTAVKGKRLEHAMEYMLAMHGAGYAIPAPCLSQVLLLAVAESGATLDDLIQRLPANVEIPGEGLAGVLDYAAKTSDIPLLKRMHKKALDEDIPLVAASYEALVRGYASIGDVQAVRLFEEMISRDFELSDGALVGLISSCAEAKHVQMAERVADYCRQKRGRLSLAVYSSLMKVYSHAKLFHKACDLYEALKEDGVKLDTVAYGCLIRAATESGRLDLARKLFQESGNPDLLNYMSLIRGAGRERNLPKALALLEDLERSPIPIDTTAYNCVLDVCVACGDQQAAKGLFKRMQERDHVDVISYNTFLKVLLSKNGGSSPSSRSSISSEVALVLQEMRSRGLKPNAVTYNSLINGAVSCGDLSGAWQYVDDMEGQGVGLDAFTCSILMKGVKHSSRKDDVEKILALIKRAGVVPDEVLVNSLLDACVRLRNGQLLTQVLERFRATGVVPSLHAYATLIKAYGHAKQLDQVWALWKELTGERKITPNEEVFTCMADACVANGDLNGAVSVIREMKPHQGSQALFSGLLRACLQRKELDRTMELYEEMDRNDGTCSLTTYNMLIDAFARAGNMDRVAKLFRDMHQKNISPDVVTYSTVIKGYCTKGDLEPALQLFSMMRKRGIKPDAILFNSILDGCAHKQMRTLTEQVLADMEAEGVLPSNFTLSILVKLYGRCGDLEQAVEVVETYPKRFAFELNAQVYTCLMSACIANEQLNRALSVLEQMKMSDCGADSKTYQTLLNGCLKHDDLENAVRLVDDALGLDGKRTGPRILLDSESIENVLFMISRRGKSTELGEPLIERLQQNGVTVSDRALRSVRGGGGAAGVTSRFHARRGERPSGRSP